MKRFWNKVTKGRKEECWIWNGSIGSDGYGNLKINQKSVKAHRYAYLEKGPLHPELIVRHTCHNKKCVNPNHLKQGTHLDNMKDMVLAKRSRVGIKNNLVKLTEKEVFEIRSMIKTGLKDHIIAESFCVGRTTIRDIRRRKTWKHL